MLDSTRIETNIVAVERVKEYGEVPQEALGGAKPPKDFPLQGRIEFKDYTLCYREGLDPALDALNFTVQSGEKIGIVGMKNFVTFFTFTTNDMN